jgi:prevent-host-death family protein
MDERDPIGVESPWKHRTSNALRATALDRPKPSDYISHMIKTLRESKATLSALVERASHGEEIIITVRGKPKARLCPMPPAVADKTTWGKTLREARARYSRRKTSDAGKVVGDLRKDRS